MATNIRTKDINGDWIKVYSDVEVPEPNDTDTHLNSFKGCVTEILGNGNCIVEDSEGDSFEIEGVRLTLIQEEYEEEVYDRGIDWDKLWGIK